ncbi:MAG: DUF4091 domain-containing protein [Planctomycetota bacterium]|nr:MAG: DUF4091 domain-containing protein [Planctomycetota bacterium]
MQINQTTFSKLLVLVAIILTSPALSLTAFPIDSSASLEDDFGHNLVIPLIKGHRRLETDLTRAPWDQAALITGFLDNKGRSIVSESTWLYVFYDRSALWMAFRCEGQGSADLKADVTERDGRVWKDDSIEVLIDPAHEHKEYFHFIVNSAGVIFDSRVKKKEWNASIRVATATDDKGWTAVLRIGFYNLRVRRPKPGAVWGVNFCRNICPSERSCWAPPQRHFIVPADFGHLVFGDEDTKPVRFRRVDPVEIGLNHLLFEPLSGLGYHIEGRESGGGSAYVAEGVVPTDGKLSWFVAEDRARRVEVTLLDRNGKRLASCWYPLSSPAVSESITRMKKKFEEVENGLPRFPQDAKRKADTILQDSRPHLEEVVHTLGDRKLYTKANWERLSQLTATLERELDDVWCYTRTLANYPHAAFAVGLESSMQKVMIRDFPFEGRFDKRYHLALAGNEHEALQVVVIPFHHNLKDVTVSVSPLRGRTNTSSRDIATEISLVGHVEVTNNQPYEVEYNGWWPDPLLSFQNKCDVNIGEHVAYWIDVSTRPDTPAGQYQGVINVDAAGCKQISIQLDVKVWDFKLPDGTHLRNAFTYHEPYVVRFYGDRWNQELAYRYYDFILDHRLNIDHLYRRESPDIELLKYGIAREMNAFNVGGVFRHITDRQAMTECDRYVSKLKQEDLFDLAYAYGYDEVKEEKFLEMREVFGTIHKRFPGLETMTTAIDHSYGKETGLRKVVDIWVPLTDWYDPEEARKLRAEGKKVWWYVCVVPPHPYANWFIEYPAIEARLLMGAMSFSYQVDGFLYYMITKWDNNHKLISSGPYTKWKPGSMTNRRGETANGDGSLLCPGPDGPLSTIRLENIRDGLEDYEYLYLLAEMVQKIKELPQNDRSKSYLDRADKLLAVPESVVRNTIKYTRAPDVLYDFRTELADCIIKGKQLVSSGTSEFSRTATKGR